jgi:hypothetical protein
MTTNRIRANPPSSDRMTILACCAHLAPMEICMAISALLTDVSKDFLHMAGITRHVLMHASERVLCLPIVIELRSTSDRRPTCCGVAVFAGDGKRPVRISNPRGFGRLAWQKGTKNRQAQCKNDTQPGQIFTAADDCRIRIRPSCPDCAVEQDHCSQ